MTVQASAWAWEQTNLPPVSKFVLLALAEDSMDDTPGPSLDGVAERCGLGLDEVDAVVSQLKDLALVDDENRTRIR